MACAIWLSGSWRSLSPASSTARGIPYTTQLASLSVNTSPPCALIHAAPSRPLLYPVHFE